MSKEEQARVLRMVAEGKITAEEAAGLLEALDPVPRGEPRTSPPPPTFGNGNGRRRSLVINVTQEGKTKVNLRIPLGIARAAGRFIPRQAQAYLDHYEIDLNQLLSDLGSSLAEGPLIEVQDEQDHVRIAVE